MNLPASLTALNFTLSPALTWPSMALSRTLNTMVMAGISRLLMSPCFNVILAVSRSTLRTSASVISSAVAVGLLAAW